MAGTHDHFFTNGKAVHVHEHVHEHVREHVHVFRLRLTPGSWLLYLAQRTQIRDQVFQIGF